MPAPAPTSLADTTVLACLLMGEAQGEPLLGKAAVAKVVWNRAKRKFSSTGTIKSVAFWPNQFDCFYYKYTTGVGYHRAANSPSGAEAICAGLLNTYMRLGQTWQDCLSVAAYAATGNFEQWETNYWFTKLGSEAVYYYNPEIVPDPPIWATPEAHLVDIGKHSFYKG